MTAKRSVTTKVDERPYDKVLRTFHVCPVSVVCNFHMNSSPPADGKLNLRYSWLNLLFIEPYNWFRSYVKEQIDESSYGHTIGSRSKLFSCKIAKY